MTFTDYAISAVLVLLVVPQVRGMRITLQSLLLPLAAVIAVAFYYLKSVPTAGHDVTLDVILVVVGAVLGVLTGLATRVSRDAEGRPYSKAGAVAAILWIAGMAARTAFVYWADHAGSHTIASFSESHMITGSDAWTAALVLMALAQVLTRLVVIRVKARALGSAPVPAQA